MPQLSKAIVRFVHVMMIVSLVGQVLVPVVEAAHHPLQTVRVDQPPAHHVSLANNRLTQKHTAYPVHPTDLGIQRAQITSTLTLTGATTPDVEPTPVPLGPTKRQSPDTETQTYFFPVIFRNAPGSTAVAPTPVVDHPVAGPAYVITADNGQYQANNPANGFQAVIDPDGISLTADQATRERSNSDQSWHWRMTLTDYGVEDEAFHGQ